MGTVAFDKEENNVLLKWSVSTVSVSEREMQSWGKQHLGEIIGEMNQRRPPRSMFHGNEENTVFQKIRKTTCC